MNKLLILLLLPLSLLAQTPRENVQRVPKTNTIIGSALSVPVQVQSIAALRAVTVGNLTDGQKVEVVCYATIGDGGGGQFYYSSGSAVADNGGTVIAPTSGSGRWLRVIAGDFVDVRWFGAVGDGATDCTSAINTAITACSSMSSAGELVRLSFPPDQFLTDGILVKSNVWLDFGGAVILKRTNTTSAATASLIRAMETLTGPTYYGTYENIKITGGFLSANGKTATANLVRILFVEGLTVDGVTVIEYTSGNWAFCLGGNDMNITRCRTIGGDAISEDGIHVMFGERITISDCDIESGDDAIALGTAIADPFVAADPYPLRGVTVNNIVVKTLLAVAVKIYTESGATGANYEISDINVSNISGKSGITRNGGVVVYDLNGSAAGTSQISRVNISNVSLDVGSTAHDETSPFGIWISSAKDVSLSNVAIKLTDKTAAATGFILAYVHNSENIELNNLRCAALQRRSGILSDASKNVRIVGGKLVATTAMVAGQSPIRLVNTPNVDINGVTVLDANDGAFGIEISTGTTTSATIRGCRIAQVAGATTGSGITVGSTAFTSLVIDDNDFTGCVAAINGGSLTAGAAFNVANNVNFVTMAQGTATVANGNTTIVVTHGLGLTPALSQIQVTPTNNLGTAAKFWISTPTSTQFTINVDADPGATTATFVWFANVGKKPL